MKSRTLNGLKANLEGVLLFHPFFDYKINLDALAAEQGVRPCVSIDELKADFWPDDESEGEFLEAYRSWRRVELPGKSG